MDDVIAATGMSSSAVYRYFRSKDELIDAAADEALALMQDLFGRLLVMDPVPTPAQTIAALVEDLRGRTARGGYDLSRIAMQAWAEALRRPLMSERTRSVYVDARTHLAELALRWRVAGHLPADADPDAVAAVLFTLMPGLVVIGHLVAPVSAERLVEGFAALGWGMDAESERSTEYRRTGA